MEKIKYKCGVKNFANLIEYQGTISTSTKLAEVDCVSVEDVIEDLYLITDEVILNSTLTNITSTCGTLPSIKNIKTLIQYLVNENCNRIAEITTLQQTEIIQNQKILALEQNICA